MAFLLCGCPWVGEQTYSDRVRDADGDGIIGDRFEGGRDCLDDNASIRDCDADGDGFISVAAGGDDCDDTTGAVAPGAPERCDLIDNDCDGAIDNDDPDAFSDTVLYADTDEDGDGDPNRPFPCQEYADPTDLNSGIHVANDNDCDDTDELIRTGMNELCDGIDNNCDGVVDDVGIWFEDLDGDGYGNATQISGSCTLGPADLLAAITGDCDDDDPNVSPGAIETPYDGFDSNCNGNLDDWDADFDGHVPDAYWAEAQTENSQLPPNEQWTIVPGDCDDTNPARFVGNPEVCDGVDNDCDDAVDTEDLANAGPADEPALTAEVLDLFSDQDGDGFFGTPIVLCPADVDPLLHSFTEDDCHDGTDPAFGAVPPETVNPMAAEICDGVDNDCDGRADWSLTGFTGSSVHFLDLDGDLFGDQPVEACAANITTGIASAGGDCNEGDVESYPGATEICGDTVRQDCSANSVWDCDGDGQEGDYFGNGTGEDCRDDNALVFQTALPNGEVCDGIDNDCDGLIDSADLDNLDLGTIPDWYDDLDGDGFGANTAPIASQCDAPNQFSAPQSGDCDDSNDDIRPDATEACNGIDDDCDMMVPNDAINGELDDDGDGYAECEGDVDDLNPAIFPGSGGGGLVAWYPDLDGDGYGDENVPPVLAATAPPMHVSQAGDCNDALTQVNVGMQQELCDGLDNNCDGAFISDGSMTTFDVGNPLLGTPLQVSGVAYATDLDLDGNFSLGVIVESCVNMGSVASLNLPEQVSAPIPLAPAVGAAATTYLDCPGGPAVPDGQLYAIDLDDDGVPGPPGDHTQVLLDCEGSYSGAWQPWDPNDQDCAPLDENRTVELQAGEYGDVDGDGHRGRFPSSGGGNECVAAAFATPGFDCNDQDANPDSFVSQSPLQIANGTEFDGALVHCREAQLDLDLANAPALDPITFTGAPTILPQADLTFRGLGGSCDGTNNDGCLTGIVNIPGATTVRFVDIGIGFNLGTGFNSQIEVYNSDIRAGAGLVITDSALHINGLDAFLPNSTVPVELFDSTAEIRSLSSFQGGGMVVDVDDGSNLRLSDVYFELNRTPIRALGQVEIDNAVFEQNIVSAIEIVGDGAVVSGRNLEFNSTNAPFTLNGNALAVCEDCTIRDTAGAVLPSRLDPNGQTPGPALIFEGGSVDMSASNSEPLIRTQPGSSQIRLDGMSINTRQRLVDSHDRVEVEHLNIDKGMTVFNQALFTGMDAVSHFTLDHVRVVDHGGPVVSMTNGGTVEAEELDLAQVRALIAGNGVQAEFTDVLMQNHDRVDPVITVSSSNLSVERMLYIGDATATGQPFAIADEDSRIHLSEIDALRAGPLQVNTPNALISVEDSEFREMRGPVPLRVNAGLLELDEVRVTLTANAGLTGALEVLPGANARLTHSLLWADTGLTFPNPGIQSEGVTDLINSTFRMSYGTGPQIHVGSTGEFTASGSLIHLPGIGTANCLMTLTLPTNVVVSETWVPQIENIGNLGCGTFAPTVVSPSYTFITGVPDFDFSTLIPRNPQIRTSYGEIAN